MANTPLSPLNDYVFKRSFLDAPESLADFIGAATALPKKDLKKIHYKNTHLLGSATDSKEGILDLKLETSSGKMIDIEVQVRKLKNLLPRIQWYTTAMYTGQITEGEDYTQLTTAMSILVADFVVFPDIPSYHSHFYLTDEKSGVRYPDSISIHTLELPKVQKSDNPRLDAWMQFFGSKTEDDFMVAVKQNPAIGQVVAIIDKLSADEEARQIAESREKYRRDMADAAYGGRLEGLVEGEAKGRAEGIARGIIIMGKRINMTDTDIINTIASELGCSRPQAENYFYEYTAAQQTTTNA